LIAEQAPARDLAWDCATGSGQAAIGLARHFARVEATDASAQQIAHALPAPNVAYSVQPAESTSFAPASFDALCVAQALHWFDLDRFVAEAKRVLRPGGVVAVVGYGWSAVSPEFDRELERVVLKPIEDRWPPQTKILMNGYRDVPFPFDRIELPPLEIEVRWTLAHFLDYIGTWTATRRKLEDDPSFLTNALVALREAWGDHGERAVTMPLVVLCGQNA
jgi:ubiquinone/menaquinone biosynthesis C-methylase UbiE